MLNRIAYMLAYAWRTEPRPKDDATGVYQEWIFDNDELHLPRGMRLRVTACLVYDEPEEPVIRAELGVLA